MNSNERQTSERLDVSVLTSARLRDFEEEVLSLCLSLDGRISGERRRIGPFSVFLKGGPFSTKGARRHQLRGILLGASSPALAEFRAAAWLRERLFQAPEPLAAVTVRRGIGPRRWKRPHAQLFISSEISGATPFDRAWEEASSVRRLHLCQELGGELGRMHALHFLHADLYPRNVLVKPAAPTEDARRVPGRDLWFIDSWAGGATAWRNGSLRRLKTDLGTWLADFEPGLSERFLKEFLHAYADARSDNGRPLSSWMRWLRSIEEARRAELRKLERQRYRLRGRPFPQAGMAASGLAPTSS
ncbi:3-deoxy-D-manno-octulosonic-acid kinase [Planctomycetes bacterium Poly30]|uniref:3-deoxy-D-manno-octulosonic-acid kinase n=1 Tax=Saltatorellus ferox TaxID=2528018 RepID=A0A518EQ36_9BACT|nr:3-deoxy-D-manno-octulosonic-acid kinase [Planctomycetes bacterium Poly30]